jgi:type I restriction enzyme, R subunit
MFPLPFQYQSTGVETRFTNLLEPDARSRRVFESTLAGIRIAAKAGKTRPVLKRIAEVASVVFAGAELSVL